MSFTSLHQDKREIHLAIYRLVEVNEFVLVRHSPRQISKLLQSILPNISISKWLMKDTNLILIHCSISDLARQYLSKLSLDSILKRKLNTEKTCSIPYKSEEMFFLLFWTYIKQIHSRKWEMRKVCFIVKHKKSIKKFQGLWIRIQ